MSLRFLIAVLNMGLVASQFLGNREISNKTKTKNATEDNTVTRGLQRGAKYIHLLNHNDQIHCLAVICFPPGCCGLVRNMCI
mmetsp:Transcript_4801/g.6943  ORF Transcript_4801/g.6943 Transcript_4801/m.6943 type:complete len:82 (+) Transcript_4801:1026-1271(+)